MRYKRIVPLYLCFLLSISALLPLACAESVEYPYTIFNTEDFTVDDLNEDWTSFMLDFSGLVATVPDSQQALVGLNFTYSDFDVSLDYIVIAMDTDVGALSYFLVVVVGGELSYFDEGELGALPENVTVVLDGQLLSIYMEDVLYADEIDIGATPYSTIVLFGNSESTWDSGEVTLTYPEAPDTTAPAYSNLNSNTTIVNSLCEFNSTWIDENALSGYIFETNNTGTFTNETWTTFNDNPQEISILKTLNETINNVISWQYYVNDTANNWNSTGLQNITLTDGTTPTFGEITATNTIANTAVTLSCTVNDNYALDTVIYAWNNTGEWINQTALSASGISYLAQHTSTWNETGENVISVKLYANDTAGNWAESAPQNFRLEAEAILTAEDAMAIAIIFPIIFFACAVAIALYKRKKGRSDYD